MKQKGELLFSITKKDFEIQTFRSGGKGGQHQNKTDSGVRIIHRDSGARAESREERSQARNKRIAFRRLCKTGKFLSWHRRRVHEIVEHKTIESEVEGEMISANLKIEVQDEDGKWRPGC